MHVKTGKKTGYKIESPLTLTLLSREMALQSSTKGGHSKLWLSAFGSIFNFLYRNDGFLPITMDLLCHFNLSFLINSTMIYQFYNTNKWPRRRLKISTRRLMVAGQIACLNKVDAANQLERTWESCHLFFFRLFFDLISTRTPLSSSIQLCGQWLGRALCELEAKVKAQLSFCSLPQIHSQILLLNAWSRSKSRIFGVHQ